MMPANNALPVLPSSIIGWKHVVWRYELPWPESSSMTVHEAWEIEQPHLMPVPGIFDGYIEVVARVSSTCLVTVKRNRYSVMCQHFSGHKVKLL